MSTYISSMIIKSFKKFNNGNFVNIYYFCKRTKLKKKYSKLNVRYISPISVNDKTLYDFESVCIKYRNKDASLFRAYSLIKESHIIKISKIIEEISKFDDVKINKVNIVLVNNISSHTDISILAYIYTDKSCAVISMCSSVYHTHNATFKIIKANNRLVKSNKTDICMHSNTYKKIGLYLSRLLYIAG